MPISNPRSYSSGSSAFCRHSQRWCSPIDVVLYACLAVVLIAIFAGCRSREPERKESLYPHTGLSPHTGFSPHTVVLRILNEENLNGKCDTTSLLRRLREELPEEVAIMEQDERILINVQDAPILSIRRVYISIEGEGVCIWHADVFVN